jgi:aspartyl-tRNA(Asn)/glutamyl-tRNA(Gln) amidotransferase subunit A
MDEFAMGSSNEHSCHGPVKNPHDLKKVSGGSSGGSAAACAAGYAPLSLGSDTGGSVREPAAFCGIYGFKPSYGRISRYGLVAYGSSLDQIAPFSRSVCDLDLILRLLGQPDAQDPKTLHTPYVSQKHSTDLFKNTTLGVFRSLLKTGIDSNVLEEFYALEDALQKRGVTIKDLSMPSSLEHALSVYYIIASAEASSNLARFDGIRYGQRAAGTKDLFDLYCKTRGEGFGPEVKRRIMMGTFALSAGHYNAYYGRAQMVRNLMQQEFDEIFKSVDFIYSPTAPSSAFDLGSNGCDSLKEYLYDIFTIPANLTGSPAISMPALLQKSSPKKLPVGLQLMAGREQDAALIAFAAALEKENLVQTTPFI